MAPISYAAVQDDEIVAILDVVGASGTQELAKREIKLSDFSDGRTFALPFEVERGLEVEFRVASTGICEIEASMARRCVLNDRALDEIIAQQQFPVAPSTSKFFDDHVPYFYDLFRKGVNVSIVGRDVHLEIDGIKFAASEADDVNFVGEIFFERAYNIIDTKPAFVIDVGLNVGLAALQFANRPYIEKVYAFEPFESTYRRALRSIRLNPNLSEKIIPNNVGLGNVSKKGTFSVADTNDSGARSIFNVASGGASVSLHIEEAGPVFLEIIKEARGRGARVIAKIDCEGSEYDIFESLIAHGALDKVWCYVMEWHGGQPGRHADVLFKPLLEAGFTIIDRSPRIGQGLFYAIKT